LMTSAFRRILRMTSNVSSITFIVIIFFIFRCLKW